MIRDEWLGLAWPSRGKTNLLYQISFWKCPTTSNFIARLARMRVHSTGDCSCRGTERDRQQASMEHALWHFLPVSELWGHDILKGRGSA
eukprot:CAMPEP_0206512022 /NCGR_PEP_ID=MMETSP0324_2-20121206/60621_1 /ASSEMBLY_ACC=CAM_ASM_000836 /TAXON_ID=2866 /ORGANISM="Crypthecodinium cohnii, Strain Seligo" /LENGTH=88 /DNA_ID=CAMNT_0054003879 /DNA_START=194 /DNA_END=457 /DNA_ORIENTATION=-